jgi:hypothetical protein
MRTLETLLPLCILGLLLSVGCGEEDKEDTAPPEGDTDTDTDADSDSDADGDADTDADTDPVSHYGSCNYDGADQCNQYIGANYATNAQEGCEMSNGVYSTDGCSLTDVLGICNLYVGSGLDFDQYYYPPIFDDTTAEATCSGQSGTYNDM